MSGVSIAYIYDSMDIFHEEGVLHSTLPRTAESYLENHRKSLAYRLETYGKQPSIKDLTALVPTLPKRKFFFDLLVRELKRQGVKVLSDDTEGITIGEKRNRMLQQVKTPYLTFIDDDDWIAPNYGKAIETAVRENPGVDYIVYDMGYYIDQAVGRVAKCGIEYDGWYDYDGVFYRDAMHFMCWRTALAQKVPFKKKMWAEDREWCGKLLKKVSTQARIEQILYAYEFLSKESLTFKHRQPQQKDSLPD